MEVGEDGDLEKILEAVDEGFQVAESSTLKVSFSRFPGPISPKLISFLRKEKAKRKLISRTMPLRPDFKKQLGRAPCQQCRSLPLPLNSFQSR